MTREREGAGRTGGNEEQSSGRKIPQEEKNSNVFKDVLCLFIHEVELYDENIIKRKPSLNKHTGENSEDVSYSVLYIKTNICVILS